jgi:hypothetical protein
MIWISCGRWSYAAGRLFVRQRLYRHGRWTPFVRVTWRYTKQRDEAR